MSGGTLKVTTQYEGQKRFSGGDGEARVLMDASTGAGGLGVAQTPKQLVLQGLAGCTGLDVAAMLEKREIAFADFTLEVTADLTKYFPQIFKKIHVTYRLRAAEEDRPVIERAIVQSKERFCGVGAMLEKSAELTWELDLAPL